MHNLIKIYHVVQELYEHFTLTDHGRTDGRTDSHSNSSADPRVVQYTMRFKNYEHFH